MPQHTVSFEPASESAPHGTLVLCAQLLDIASAAEVTLEARALNALRCHAFCLQVASHQCVMLCVSLTALRICNLQASDWEAVLLRAGGGDAALLLRVALPAACVPDGAAARWDKRARRLTVRLPCAAPA